MRALRKKNKQDFNTKTSLWDAFVSHLESIYYPGATETLESELINFEYENFKSSCAV